MPLASTLAPTPTSQSPDTVVGIIVEARLIQQAGKASSHPSLLQSRAPEIAHELAIHDTRKVNTTQFKMPDEQSHFTHRAATATPRLTASPTPHIACQVRM